MNDVARSPPPSPGVSDSGQPGADPCPRARRDACQDRRQWTAARDTAGLSSPKKTPLAAYRLRLDGRRRQQVVNPWPQRACGPGDRAPRPGGGVPSPKGDRWHVTVQNRWSESAKIPRGGDHLRHRGRTTRRVAPAVHPRQQRHRSPLPPLTRRIPPGRHKGPGSNRGGGNTRRPYLPLANYHPGAPRIGVRSLRTPTEHKLICVTVLADRAHRATA